jgi:ankyrin repeat protein
MCVSFFISLALSLATGISASETGDFKQLGDNGPSILLPDTVEAARQELSDQGVPFTADAFVGVCERGLTDLIALFLVAEMDPNAADKRENSCLIAAAFEGYSDVARDLLAAGADVDVRDRHGATPLMHAASQGYAEIAGLLVEEGANVNAVEDFYDWTPLFFAAYDGYAEIVSVLLEAGANPDHVSTGSDWSAKTLYTALMEAASRGYSDVVEALLDANADVTPKSLTGETAEDLAERMGFKRIAELIRERSS